MKEIFYRDMYHETAVNTSRYCCARHRTQGDLQSLRVEGPLPFPFFQSMKERRGVHTHGKVLIVADLTKGNDSERGPHLTHALVTNHH